MDILPIGTVIILEDGTQELMITSRYPLYDNKGEVGYFDYAGCLYPQGMTSEDNYFFNQEDIKEIIYMGYESNDEKKLRENILEQIQTTTYKKINIKETLN